MEVVSELKDVGWPVNPDWKVEEPEPGRSAAMKRAERERAMGDQELPSMPEAGEAMEVKDGSRGRHVGVFGASDFESFVWLRHRSVERAKLVRHELPTCSVCYQHYQNAATISWP